VARNKEASQHYLGSPGSSVEVSSCVVVCTASGKFLSAIPALLQFLQSGSAKLTPVSPRRSTLKACDGKELACLLTTPGIQMMR
jgi:hypothetical protein